LNVGYKLKGSERAPFLNPLVRDTFADADSRNESLTILRPRKLELDWLEKSNSELEEERQKHAELANQMSFFDESATPLEPCPLQFTIIWEDNDGKQRKHECDDWETSTAFNRFEREYSRAEAINILKSKYEDEYFNAGLVLAFSTHSRRNITNGISNQWLLVGIVRLDYNSQGDLLL
jgi:hypothetical protein